MIETSLTESEREAVSKVSFLRNSIIVAIKKERAL